MIISPLETGALQLINPRNLQTCSQNIGQSYVPAEKKIFILYFFLVWDECDIESMIMFYVCTYSVIERYR